MAKKSKAIKCSKCDLEFPGSELSEKHTNQAFIFDDRILCKDCLVMMGGDPNVAAAFVGNQHNQEKAKQHDW